MRWKGFTGIREKRGKKICSRKEFFEKSSQDDEVKSVGKLKYYFIYRWSCSKQMLEKRLRTQVVVEAVESKKQAPTFRRFLTSLEQLYFKTKLLSAGELLNVGKVNKKVSHVDA